MYSGISPFRWLAPIAVLLCAGCGEGGNGDQTATVLLEAEDSIAGLLAGSGDEEIADGWSVRFDKYVIVVGDVELRLATDPGVASGDPELFAIDLISTPPAGQRFWSVGGLAEARWQFGYRQGSANEATRDPSVSELDFERMRTESCTYLIEGALIQEGGRTCPPNAAAVPDGATPDADGCYVNPEVEFSLCVSAETRYGPCELDGLEGVAVTSTGASASISIHGDHVFFNGFPEGEEGGVTRLAQWLADCDLDLDGEVTRAELESIRIDDLAEIDARFQLGGAPTLPGGAGLSSVWSYIRAQLSTQGHFNGEGECAVSTN